MTTLQNNKTRKTKSRLLDIPRNQKKKNRKKKTTNNNTRNNMQLIPKPFTTGYSFGTGTVRRSQNVVSVSYVVGAFNYSIANSLCQAPTHPFFLNAGLTSIARMYQKWRCTNFCLKWVPSCSTAQTGTMFMGVRKDCFPLNYSDTLSSLLASEVIAAPVWQMAELRITPSKEWLPVFPSVKTHVPDTLYAKLNTSDLDMRQYGLCLFEATYEFDTVSVNVETNALAEELILMIGATGVTRTVDIASPNWGFVGLVTSSTVPAIDVGELVTCSALFQKDAVIGTARLVHNEHMIDFSNCTNDRGMSRLNCIDAL